jgi:hypothetical protein
MEFFQYLKEINTKDRNLKEFTIIPLTIDRIRDFVQKWHYSKNVNGISHTHCFGMFCDGTLIGGMIFGKLGMANVWKKYAEKEEDILELRRLCLIDDTPKNAESYFIGWALRWLKRNTGVKIIISYSDEEWNHIGTIYKAANFQYVGMSSGGRVIHWEGRRYHDKSIRTYYTDKWGDKRLKPFAQNLIQKLESGEAEWKETGGKRIWIYRLKD